MKFSNYHEASSTVTVEICSSCTQVYIQNLNINITNTTILEIAPCINYYCNNTSQSLARVLQGNVYSHRIKKFLLSFFIDQMSFQSNYNLIRGELVELRLLSKCPSHNLGLNIFTSTGKRKVHSISQYLDFIEQEINNGVIKIANKRPEQC